MKIFYLIGPSGSGKDTLRSAMLHDDDIHIEPLINITNRPMRSGEVNGREYSFVTDERFNELKESGNLIESRSYKVNDGKVWSYATLAVPIDDDSIYLGAGTTDSYKKIHEEYGDAICRPVYIKVADDTRLNRTILRCGNKRKGLLEVCRRFISDCEEYSPETLSAIGISRVNTIDNNDDVTAAYHRLRAYIMRHTRTERK